MIITYDWHENHELLLPEVNMNIGMHPDFDGLFYNRKESESAFKIAEAQFASFKDTITSNITGLSFELKVLPGKALLRATLRSTSFYFVLLRSPQISSDLAHSPTLSSTSKTL